MKKQTNPAIPVKDGVKVYHNILKQELTVVADEKGPAYTGNEFKDNEISLSHAITEYKNGNLTPVKDEGYDIGYKEGYHSALNDIEFYQKWEVHKQRKSGIGNTGYGYAILMPLITKEGEYKGEVGGYHVIVHQDANITKELAESICNDHNSFGASAPQLKADNERLKEQLSDIAGEANASVFQLIGKEKRITELLAANKELIEALNKVKNWELPATGQFWDKEEKQPMSYGAAYGSNGERDYFKNIAAEAIQKHSK